MNLADTAQLRGPLQALIDSGSRINPNKPEKYWYPLSVATYDVEEVLAAVDSLCSFRTTMWEKTAEFERAFAATQGSAEAVMVNSGSSADLLIAFALVNPEAALLSPGDEILVPAVTWPTQLWSVMMAGLRPVLVDVDPLTLNVDIGDLESKLTSRTRAMSLVHLMGNPCDMDNVKRICRERDLVLVEDCCEALGARFDGRLVGTFGIASSFSFFFSHHITTMEGGMVCCQDPSLSDLFRLLRAHGWARNTKYTDVDPGESLDPRYTFLNWGFNVRPTEPQAAFGLEQLKRLPTFHKTRQANAEHFRRSIERHEYLFRLMRVDPRAECSWFALPIVLADECPFTRTELVSYLEDNGVETRPIVAGSLVRHPVTRVFPQLQGFDLPGADVVHDRGFYLGLYPFESSDKLDRLADMLDRFVRDQE